MNLLLSRLDEAQRRWYAAVEATRLGHGGVRLVAQITGLDEKTIRRGQGEVAGSMGGAGGGPAREGGGAARGAAGRRSKKRSGHPDGVAGGGRAGHGR